MRNRIAILFCCILLVSCTTTVKNTGVEEDEPKFFCHSAADCGVAEMCNADGMCVPYCSYSMPCPSGYNCDLDTNECVSKTATDGDKDPVDGDDEPIDGDLPADGDDTPVDGDDEPVDGDTEPVDGDDEPVDGDTPQCEPECGFGYICNDTGDKCVIDRSIFPSHCKPCNNDDSCENDNRCTRDPETLEQYCAAPCIDGEFCMEDAMCDQNYCVPEENGCGLPRPVGGACEPENSFCSEGLECLTEINGRTFNNGICTTFCTADDIDQDCEGHPGTRCTGLRLDENSDYVYLCINRCQPDGASCREGYECVQVNSNDPFRPSYICSPQTMR